MGRKKEDRRKDCRQGRDEKARQKEEKEESSGDEFDPPLFLTDLMKELDSDDETKPREGDQEGEKLLDQEYETKVHRIGGVEIEIREFAFSATNAGFVWPATRILAGYLVERIDSERLREKKILELGSGTGVLSICMKKLGLDIVSSDVVDEEVANNILYNQKLNGVEFKHIPHFWGEEFPKEEIQFDLIIASDILLYVNQYPNLLKTMKQLMQPRREGLGSRGVEMVMCYKRKIHGERTFFPLLTENGFEYEVLGHKLYRIWLKQDPSPAAV